MKVLYLSHFYDNKTPSYGGKDSLVVTTKTSIKNGNTSNTVSINFSNNHLGTHVDFPKHFFNNGLTITDVNPEYWFFNEVVLIDVINRNNKQIEIEDIDLTKINEKVDFLILRTGLEKYRGSIKYIKDYTSLSPQLCFFLKKKYKKLRGIGFDFISLSSPKFKEEGKITHKIFLDNSNNDFICIVEDMKLKEIELEIEKLIISPLLIKNGDGSPVSIFAIV